LTDMSPGVSRKQGTVELTRDASSADTATSSPLSSVAMSADGRYLGIVTSRTQFTLPALQLVGTARTVPGPHELYVVDLQQRTLERVAHSIGGGDIDGGVQDGVSLSDGAQRVAFSSFAGNLFRGDANQRADTFVATLLPQPGEGTPDGAGGSGGGGSSVTVDRAGPRVLVRAKAKAAGVVVLTISVPAAGAIEAVAKGRSGKPPRMLTIATRKTHARGKGSFHVVMRAAPRFRPRLREGNRLTARVSVTFSPAAGGRRLHASTTVAFTG
ncbi:MAG TPA: hypothetical protein VK659_23895, partial [Asanoa sp.]|nr:hypothetical protein [Asanoa sp.]